MDKNYTGKDGLSIKLIKNKINQTINKRNKEKVKLRKTYASGTLKSDDMKKITIGSSLLYELIYNNIYFQKDKLLLGDKDISKAKVNIWNFRNVLDSCSRDLYRLSSMQYDYKFQMEVLENYADIAQAARDGVILKQETRKEKVDGKEKEVMYDTSMTHSEIMQKIQNYEKLSDSIETKKLRSYLELGLGIAGILGTLSKAILGPKKENKTDKKGLAIGIATVGANIIPIIGNPNWRQIRDKQRALADKTSNLKNNAIYNEQISSNAKKDSVEAAKKSYIEELDWRKKQFRNETMFSSTILTAMALITGIFINSKVTVTENGKIDGKSLAHALLSLQLTRKSLDSTIKAISRIGEMKLTNEQYKQACEELRKIIKQMEEKVYPLQGTNKAFEKLEIKDFEGKFYPKKNYETGEIIYSTKLTIPEFSMKKGETVLLSGESGTGKSTFLRLLKRGDINNRKCIKLDGEEFDNLGDQYISFRPDIELGNETNILFQITGKESVTSLNKQEKTNLMKIMKELELDFGLNSKELLEQMASKKFMEYSTGQQKRLALSKLFYRITDGTSAIIVDEPVGNVEDRLIRQQLEMIKKYAKKQNVMLLMVTHRIDAVKDLVDRRYNIDNNGVMTEIQIKKEINEAER